MAIVTRCVRTARTVGVLLWAMVCADGCIGVPPCAPPSPQMTREDLSQHVQFLAQPDLKGRSPKTLGSAAARRYLCQHFKACGLVPWGKAGDYAQAFMMGTNVVGVLPGSDPNLAREFVVLAAHYDHLGWTQRGLCLGACDNASGVAALLDVAQELALSQTRPRRSICLAAFDCEEEFSLGALAFTCRDDFDPNRIAGVVNLDMLGRNGFEVLDRHLFVIGTESYPDLRRQIRTFAKDQIEILPVGTDITGPRGDHVVFEPLGIPSLFFTCSLYKDYHRPGDTADQVDYDNVLRSARVAVQTVRFLADSPHRLEPTPAVRGDVEELEALRLCLGRVDEHPERLGLTEPERQSVKALLDKTQQLLQEAGYSLEDRRHFLWWHAIETLVPLTERFESPAVSRKAEPPDEKALAVQRRASCLLFMEGRRAMVEVGQALVRHVSRCRHPLLMGVATFESAKSWVPDRYVGLTPLDDRRYVLVAAWWEGHIRYVQPPVWLWPLQGPSLSASPHLFWFGAEGTREDLVDICLLAWGSHKDPNDHVAPGQASLNRIADTQRAWTYRQWLDWRLAQGPWPDEESWILDRARSGQWHVVRQALHRAWQGQTRTEAESITCAILSDPNAQPCLRDVAVRSATGKVGQETLLALARMIDDKTPIPDCSTVCRDPFLRELYDYVGATDKKADRSAKPKAKPKQRPPASLGDLAQGKIRELTRQDFGKDRQAWVRWIERHRE